LQQAVQKGREAKEARNQKYAIKESSVKSLKPEDMSLEPFDYNHERREISKYHTAKNVRGLKIQLCGPYYKLWRRTGHPSSPDPDTLTPENDPYGIQKDRYKDKLRAHDKKLEKYEQDKQNVYSLVWGLCTHNMQNMLRNVEHFGEWSREKDFMTLWGSIVVLSVIRGDINEDEDQRKNHAKIRFSHIRQFQDESVGDFYVRFEQEVEVFESAGNEFVESFIVGDDDDPRIIAAKITIRREK
jgi:uncharacterized CHY-type Zn-finger protein